MSFQSDHWDMFYYSYPAKDILNKKLDQIIKLLPATATQDKCITVLWGTPGLSLLAVDEFNEVLLLHQVMITGPNLLQPESKIMALMGSMQSLIVIGYTHLHLPGVLIFLAQNGSI